MGVNKIKSEIEEVTKEEYLQMVKDYYHVDDPSYRIKMWGFWKCIDCPNCRFYKNWKNTINDNPILMNYPHCTVVSEKGRRCVAGINKKLGCPKGCPKVSSEDKLNIQLNSLKKQLAYQEEVIQNANAKIQLLQNEIHNLEGIIAGGKDERQETE